MCITCYSCSTDNTIWHVYTHTFCAFYRSKIFGHMKFLKRMRGVFKYFLNAECFHSSELLACMLNCWIFEHHTMQNELVTLGAKGLWEIFHCGIYYILSKFRFNLLAVNLCEAELCLTLEKSSRVWLEIITLVSSVYVIFSDKLCILGRRSFMYVMKSKGSRIDLWGTPYFVVFPSLRKKLPDCFI